MPTLVIFDIDDTLTRSRDGWKGSLSGAVEHVFGEGCITEWRYDKYPHVTAHGMVDEICRARLGRPASAEELAGVCAAQLANLRRFSTHPQPVAGALAMLRLLRRTDGWAAAIASGNFDLVSRFKLEATGFDVEDLPMASSDDDISRAGLTRIAIARAQRIAGRDFDRMVYVGDGAWDVRTTRQLGLPMVGIAPYGDTHSLQSQGVSHVLTDYRDTDAVLQALLDARVAE